MAQAHVHALAIVAFLLLLSGCSSTPVAPVIDLSKPHKHSAQTSKIVSKYHVVKIGETLYSISALHGYDYKQVAAWNGIPEPYQIHPGQRLRLAPPTEKSRPNRIRPRSLRSTSRPAIRQQEHLGWVWPVTGNLLSTYSSNQVGKKGIDIGGQAGAPIVAAAAGEVVYSGNGLIRYGNLIIIKHNDRFFSAYAHNRKLLVKEGDRVRAGQRIAEMGNTGTDRTMLHFEIRQNGRPVDPLAYLPKQ